MASRGKSGSAVEAGVKKRAVRFAKTAVSKVVFFTLRIAFGLKADPTTYSLVIPEATYSPWLADHEFQDVRQAVDRHTMMGEYKLYDLWQLTGQLASIEGDILEVGVWRGGSGCLIAKRSQTSGSKSKVFLCDTFEGVAKAGEHDPNYSGGEHADTSEEIVRDLAESMGLRNTTALKGIFPDDTGAAIAERRFKLCHIDVDVYESANATLAWVWDRMIPGGLVIYDDFGNLSTPGVTKHVNEQMGRGDRIIVHNLNGHAIMIKLPRSAT
jgi:O-methyltransferase